MANFGQSIRYNVANLTRFEGRDAPRHYWPYIGLLIGLHFIAGLFISIPIMIDAFTGTFAAVGQQAAGAPPPDPQHLQAQMMQQMMSSVGAMLPYTVALGLIVDFLALAATVRRLHDRNWSGWWAALIFVSLAIGLASNWWTMHIINGQGVDALIDHMASIQLLGWLPWVGYIILLIQLVQGGDVGDNRFGPEPDRSW